MRRSCFRRAPKRVLISLGVLLLTLPVWAEEAELTLTEAIQRTLTESPLLRAQGFLAEDRSTRSNAI